MVRASPNDGALDADRGGEVLLDERPHLGVVLHERAEEGGLLRSGDPAALAIVEERLGERAGGPVHAQLHLSL